ncbi:SusC/RagA family TonB-linked outer membrane protein [Chitinophaga sp. GCM10012297]|uniref:SusC/RagA family TonB-linked outer membrane protein n=1 Tax=Chitinophaga chungangae TaxID=2821488 RepID=A0ABS3YFQ2_9BACT|nr:SusC/RagA family TonB-linked outer membrane protein [Chitinophaga chungangae]MBO9153484.1 SusC/RagA family TonB-linked outer membrane protein [Chitinophaga chungangae]
MKFTSFLLLAICLHVSASTFSQSITFSGRDVPMKKLFATIKKQTGFVVWGKSELLQKAGTVSVSVQNMPLTNFLDLVMKDQPFNYKIADNTIMLYSKPMRTAGNETPEDKGSPVTGRVTDSTGVPLIGATVLVMGTRQSAATNEEGNFTLPVSAGNILRISFIGYKTREIAITRAMLQSGNAGIITLSVLSSTLTELNITANTGYQSIPKERATGSFRVITEETLGARMETGLMDRLEGTVPGLFMQNGTPTIRGLSTLYGNQAPLYVVDGFPYEGDLNYINPADVVNVTVMKDAAAASIYGTRAANGVISITTRRGNSGKLTVNFSSTAFVTGKPDAGYLNLLNSKQMVDMQEELFNKWHPSYNDAIRRGGSSKALEALYDREQGLISQAELDETLDRLRGYDGQSQLEDLYMRNRIKHRQSFSATGGNDVHRYNIFMNYTGNSGYGLQTRNQDVNIGLRDNVKVFKWLDAEIGATTNIRNGKYIRESPESFYRNMPYEILRNPDGSSAPFTTLKSRYEIERLKALGLHDETFNPLDEMDKADLSYWSNYFRLQGGFTIKIIPGLTLDLKYQTERGTSYDKQYYTSGSYYAKNLINDAAQIDANGEIIYNVPNGGQVYETRGNSKSYTARAQLNFDREIAPRHRLTALAGVERRAISNATTSLFKMGYNDNNLQFQPVDEPALGSLKGTQSLNGLFFWNFNGNTNFTYVEERYISTYANAGYTFNGKYNLTGSARIDNSNLFGTDPRYRYLPLWSVGASWRLTEEDFMKDIRWLNSLSVRSTYGLGGNVARNVGPFLQARSTFMNEANATATDILFPPNKSLRWEKTATTNIGIDFAVLNNRISGSMDYYIRNSTDLLGEKLTDPTNAFPYALINYGSMKNKGFEMALNTQNINAKHFSWNSTLALSFNKNRMTDINLRNMRYDLLTAGYGVNRIGYPMDALFSFKYAGLDPTNGTVMLYDAEGKVVTNYDQTGTVVANMTDINGLAYSGTLRPKYTMGLTNSFTYKQFSLSVMIIANGGNVMRDVVGPIQNNFGKTNVDARTMNFWRKPGDENVPGMLPAPDLSGSGREYYNLIWFANDQNVLKGDYIKVRDIALSYNFAPALSRIKKLSSAKLTLQVQNPFSWYRNDADIDPEAYVLASTYANRSLPVMPVYMAGIDITF